jgi:sulfite reductase beta subunit-like hemoprotein
MELKTFVAETLKQLIDGVKSSQEYAQKEGAVINPNEQLRFSSNHKCAISGTTGQQVQIIDFDVAISAQESDQYKGGFGIFVGAVGIGTQGHAEFTDSTVNRIKFSLPIVLPYQDSE